MTKSKPRTRILGVAIDTISLSQAVTQLTDWLTQPQNQPKLVFTPNPEMLVYAERRSDFKAILNLADLNLPDGIGVVWFSHGTVTERVTGTDVVRQLIQLPQRMGCVMNPKGLSSKIQIQVLLPQAEIITATESFTTQPELVLVALGSPEQEQWISRHRKLPGCRVLMGVGGSLDHLTGTQKRAPLLFQWARLEWLWRLILQPRRWKRIITATIVFPYLMFTHRQSHD